MVAVVDAQTVNKGEAQLVCQLSNLHITVGVTIDSYTVFYKLQVTLLCTLYILHWI